jgi:naphthoate synthase
MGLVNKVVPPEELEKTVMTWANDLLQRSPTALRFLKHALNADTDHVYGFRIYTEQGALLRYRGRTGSAKPFWKSGP